MPERVIGGKRYEVQVLPTRRRFDLLGRIRQIQRTTGFESPLDLSPDIRDSLIETSTVDGKPLLPVVDALLSLPDLLAVMAFAVEVNFEDFFNVKPASSEAAIPTAPAAPSGG